MRPRYLPLLLGLALLPLAQVLYPGCATLVSGPKQQVLVKTKPVGAQVFVNGKLVGIVGEMPVAAVVSRWGFHRVRIELAGYEPYEVKLEKHYNDTASANVYIGGAWIVIDALTGAIFEQDVPTAERAKLMKWLVTTPLFASSPLLIGVELKPTPSARKIGQMVRRRQ